MNEGGKEGRMEEGRGKQGGLGVRRRRRRESYDVRLQKGGREERRDEE